MSCVPVLWETNVQLHWNKYFANFLPALYHYNLVSICKLTMFNFLPCLHPEIPTHLLSKVCFMSSGGLLLVFARLLNCLLPALYYNGTRACWSYNVWKTTLRLCLLGRGGRELIPFWLVSNQVLFKNLFFFFLEQVIQSISVVRVFKKRKKVFLKSGLICFDSSAATY